MAVSPARMNRRQRGVALITALLVVALATVAAVAMASRQQMDVRRTANLLDGDQAYAYAQGVESWGRVVLARDGRDNLTDKFDDAWAQRLPPIPVPGGQIDGYVQDQQGRFNINNLVDANGAPSQAHIDYFNNLLNALQLSPDLTGAVIDWLDKDTTVYPQNGAEDDYYLLAQVPYRAANQRFQSISELRLVRGFDAEIWNKLAPHIAALPDITTLNVNTAGPVLLQALDPSFSPQDGEQLAEARPAEGYADVNTFLQHPKFSAWQGSDAILGVDSKYFLIRAEINVGTARTRLFSLVHRERSAINTLARTQGTW